MSLDKAIESGKEHRRPYRGSAAFSSHCRNHSSKKGIQCGACKGNRLYTNKKREMAAISQEME